MLLPSCRKAPGPGGTSSITGKVYVKDYNANGTVLLGEYYGPEIKVYIIYGDHQVYDDWMRTNYDGAYLFDYLNPGSYTVFTYSRCDSCPSGVEPVKTTVQITGAHQVVEVPDLVIKN